MAERKTRAENEALAMLVAAATRGIVDARAVVEAAAEVGLRAAQLGDAATTEVLLEGLLPADQIGGALAHGSIVLQTIEAPPSSRGRRSLPPARTVAPPPPTPRFDARYDVAMEIGRGGAGIVASAHDGEIGRTVAMKTLRVGINAERHEIGRFLDEARVTGQLEHPGIVPIYDLGQMPDGQPFYTMRIVERRTLREVIGGLAEPTRHDWPLARLCHVMVQVSRALDYAHRRGVVHRDIKPENILLGHFGEVYVADWGIAKRADAAPGSARMTSAGHVDNATLIETHHGSLLGTVGYMSPEQILGRVVDGRSDLFSLGVVLYEVLTHGRSRPFVATTPIQTLLATVERPPPRPRELAADCPLVLEELCMRLLAKEPDDRPASGEAVAEEIESYLEGDKERARREAEALRLVAAARAQVERHARLDLDRERHLAESRTLLRDCKPHDPIDGKRAGWIAEDRAGDVAIAQADALARALHAYSQAIGLAPHAKEVRGGLADLYWMRFERATRENDAAAQAYHEALVREWDAPENRYAPRLSADSFLSLRSHPGGAEVVAFRFVSRDRVLVAEDPFSLGQTPIVEARLPPGSYLLVLKREGHRDTPLPVACLRGEHHQLDVNLYTDAEIGDEFVYVPGGTCIVGGDADAFDALPRRELDVPDFTIARHPVTYAEYLAFIDDLSTRDPKEAEKRVPRDESGDGLYAMRDPDTGKWVPRYDRLIEGEGRKFSPIERAGELPVMAVDWFDAMAYVRWRAARDARDGRDGEVRLPSEIEFEKCARGVDGRRFPWGDRFDASFCKMRESRRGFPQPEPVGAFAVDRGPYGVADLSGGMREWVADIFVDGVDDELSVATALAAEEPGPNRPRDEAGMRMSRGGAWCDAAINTRAASRVRYFTMFRTTRIGFRRRGTLPPR